MPATKGWDVIGRYQEVRPVLRATLQQPLPVYLKPEVLMSSVLKSRLKNAFASVRKEVAAKDSTKYMMTDSIVPGPIKNIKIW
jgi:hypothetical protein